MVLRCLLAKNKTERKNENAEINYSRAGLLRGVVRSYPGPVTTGTLVHSASVALWDGETSRPVQSSTNNGVCMKIDDATLTYGIAAVGTVSGAGMIVRLIIAEGFDLAAFIVTRYREFRVRISAPTAE